MAWIELKLKLTAEQAEALEARLFELGAQAVTYRAGDSGELFEPAPADTPLWERAELVALFNADTDVQQLTESLGSEWEFGLSRLEDQVWERAWIEHYRPMQFGRNFWILPSYAPEPDESDAVCLELDPGLAFGTGTHPTTALCLEYLEAHRPVGKQLVDYGCGSGVLALAALKLGADRAFAVDYDPQALAATDDNRARNSIESSRLILSDPQSLECGPVDLVIANILSSTLIDLAPVLRKLVKRGGQIVLSGILVEQAESVAAAYEFGSVDKYIRDGWVLLCSNL